MEWESTWIRGGKIDEVAWIDRDIIAWYSGAHVVFFNLIVGKQRLFSCAESPDGVCCITGNPTRHLVVFAEKRRNPRILVYSYPNMTKVSECCDGCESGYLATAFAPSTYLVSLGSSPTYSIIIWNWKSGDKLSSLSSPIHDLYGQMIRVSLSQPMFIAQLGRNSKILLIWTVTAVASNIIMSHEQIVLPNEAAAVYIDWSSHQNDSQLAIADEHGNVYISNRDGSEINRVVFSQRCAVCLDYEMPIVCWFQDGIMLKTTFCQMRYYKRNSDSKWKRERYIASKLKPYIITRNPFAMNELFYFTEEGFLMQMNLSTIGETKLTVDEKFHYGGIHKFMDFIYPWAHDLVVIEMNFNLSIVDVMNGEYIGRLYVELDGAVTQLLSHPDYPLVAIITSSGELFLITVIERYNPSVLLKYRLQSEQLDILKFSQCGKHLIVGEKTSGNCFCITSILKNEFSKIYQLEIKREIVDVALYDDAGVLKVLILILSSTIAFVSNYIFTYELLPSNESFTQATIITHLPAFYQFIHYAPKNINILITSPYPSRHIHYFERSSVMRMSLIGAEATSHHIRGLKIYTNRRCITTSGIDGMVTVSMEGETYTKTPIILLTHHRADLGVSKAICNLSGSLVIALGHNGAMVCLILRSNGKPDYANEVDRKKIISSDYAHLYEGIFAALSGLCRVIPSENVAARTWVEWKEEQILMKEEKICRVKRLRIKEKFNVIKTKIQEMLDENDRCGDDERLPVAAFDLAIFAREQKIKLAREEREDIRLQLEFECSSMRKVAEWIKATFWDPQITLSKSICSIFGDDEVTNYPTIPDDPQEKEMFVWNDYLKKMNTEANHVSSELKRDSLIKYQDKPCQSDERSALESLLIDDDDEEYDNVGEKKEEQYASEGVTTHRFIQPSSQYSQFRDYDYSQFLSITSDILNDVHQLKNYFNKLFENMFATKRQVVALLCERNKRIRHIDSELRLLFNQSIPQIVRDPEWRPQEHPQSIIDVLNNAVMAKPYISLSQQEHPSDKVDDEKRIKLQVMKDDFYEKTLQEIMDGVLEVKWEDIIKKDIPKPPCMLSKSPDEYNVEDILIVQKYDSDIQMLKKEREKYRRILEADFTKMRAISLENVEKFNLSLREFSSMKMKVESAIQQLHLLRTRGYLQACYRLRILRDIDSYQREITDNNQRIEKILQKNDTLQALLPELRSQREILLAKEKLMLNQFKMEFRSFGKMTMEILRKQYRRRPKLSITHAAADDFLELGRRVITSSRSKFSCDYCEEYLTGVDAMDVRPTGLSESVTPHDWSQLVKVRRNKIELEMRLKANWMEINGIDRNIADNHRKIERLKFDVFELENQLSQIHQKCQEFNWNMEIQVVLKMGQVEISLSGEKNDTAHSILMPRNTITKINERILRAGDEKLRAMRRTMKFNRGRAFKEWQHKYLNMKIANLRDDLCEIRNFPVNKELEIYLNGRSINLKYEKTHEKFEKHIEAMKMTLDKSLKELIAKLEKVEVKIEQMRRDNESLDRAITRMNVDRWELELERDLEAEDRCREFKARKMALALRRSRLVSKIQQQYTENLALQTHYELCQLKKYPSLSTFKISGDGCQ